MAQTTGATSWRDAEISLSTDGASWTDRSGHNNSVSLSGGDRASGAAYTADGDTAIITRGKRAPITITASFVYTETAAEPYDTINDAYEAGTDLYIRWSAKGGDSGELMHTSSAGIVKSFVTPQGASDSGDPILFDLVLEVASITESTIA